MLQKLFEANQKAQEWLDMNFTPAELFAIEQLQQKMLLKLNQLNACKQKEASEH